MSVCKEQKDNSEHMRVLGVDGGGSKTIAWIANVRSSTDHRGFEFQVMGRGHAGPSNPRSVGFDLALANILAAISMAQSQLSDVSEPIDSACLSLAGAGRAAEQDRIRDWAESIGLAKHTVVVDDVEPLRFAAIHEQASLQDSVAAEWDRSITLVVGTGSIACGRNGGERSVRVGGWGYLLGDEGSGFSIGLACLQALCKSHDRAEEPSEMVKATLRQLGLNAPSELVGFVYQQPLPRAQVAELSEIVFHHADIDPVAAQIVAGSIQAMAELVATAVQRLELTHRSYSLALSGGIVSNHAIVVERLLQDLERKQLAPVSHQIVRLPIYGALSMAAQCVSRHDR